MVVTLLHVVAVLLVGLCFFVYWFARRGTSAQRQTRQTRRADQPGQPRRLSPLALEGAATGLGVVAIAVSVALKIW
jgi:hypothetical protein